jgi:hypothetical protein
VKHIEIKKPHFAKKFAVFKKYISRSFHSMASFEVPARYTRRADKADAVSGSPQPAGHASTALGNTPDRAGIARQLDGSTTAPE